MMKLISWTGWTKEDWIEFANSGGIAIGLSAMYLLAHIVVALFRGFVC